MALTCTPDCCTGIPAHRAMRQRLDKFESIVPEELAAAVKLCKTLVVGYRQK